MNIEKIKEALGILKDADVLNPERCAQAIDEAVRMVQAEMDKAAPVRYASQGPPIQMQDVLLACGELNKRERVAVQWVLDKVSELPQQADKAPC